jgi:hypothetical protein
VPLGPPDLRSTVLRFCVPVTLRRYPASTRNASGLEVRGAPTESTIRAHVWPFAGDDEQLPEGFEAGDAVEGNTPDEVLVDDSEAGTPADEIVWQGSTYEITSVGPWQGGPAQGSSTFYAFTAVRVTGRPAAAVVP